ncbi:hypothetical protein TRFO_24006 [Tritrichomonas foetus]|uniref:Protein kinase domain-containing protein n=1 Tax=Tritrichomonas foetus TaxID=1144522 RepID=A0A1J4K8A2_9EUKA|nr:hypothetical protein TRFO_24006 [Tritrichomonas foetus]|eukprot:OHT07729.1 hypothetical protein TRFO_24006 [Tritrichomonas foetus]
MFKTACGTVGYTAPEVIKREPYNDKVDIWSAGIILYTMVTGHLPFLHENLQEVYQQIISKDPYFPPNLSKEMVDLISLLLNKEPNERPSFEDIFEIPIVAKTVSEHSNIVNYLLQQPLRESTNKSNSDLNEDKSYEEDINENEAKNREKDHIFLTCTKNEIASRIRNLMKLKSTLMNNGLITNSNSVEQIAFPRKVFRPIPRIASSKHQGVKIVSIPFPVRINSPPVKIIPNKNQAIMIPTVSNQIALPNMQIFQPHLRRSTF